MVGPGSVVALAEREILRRAGAPVAGWTVGAEASNGLVDARLVVMAALPHVMERVLRDAPGSVLQAGSDADCLRSFMEECVAAITAPR